MGSRPEGQTKLQRRISYALLHDWDPIGVEQYPEARDEYDDYVPEICQLLARNASQEAVFLFLWRLETDHMGLRGDRGRTEAFAKRLIQIRNETEA